MSINVVICCDPSDDEHRQALEKHLATLKRQHLIESWHSGKISPGSHVDEAIAHQIDEADIVLLLVSPDFLASSHCYEVQMRRALVRHQRGEVQVIPILARSCDFAEEPFAKLRGLPRNGTAITSWPNRDEAWTDVVLGIREALKDSADIPGRREEAAPSPFFNPRCEKVMEELMEMYKASKFPPPQCWAFRPADHDEMLAFMELAARGYIRQDSPDSFFLEDLGHRLILKNTPISEETQKVIIGIRARYVAWGFYPHRAWWFTRMDDEKIVSYNELQARGLIEIWTEDSWRLTDYGLDFILALH